jgi:hypothetical protein
MNQGKMQKVSTYSFSNIQNSSQGATHVQMSKLDTLQVHRIEQFCENVLSHEQSPRYEQNMSQWPSHTNFMLGQPF